MVSTSAAYSPDTRAIEGGYSTSVATGGELSTPVPGLVGIFEHSINGSGENTFLSGIGLGHGFEFHTAVQHEYTFVLDVLPGTGSSHGSGFESIGPNSSHGLDFSTNSSSFRPIQISQE